MGEIRTLSFKFFYLDPDPGPILVATTNYVNEEGYDFDGGFNTGDYMSLFGKYSAVDAMNGHYVWKKKGELYFPSSVHSNTWILCTAFR